MNGSLQYSTLTRLMSLNNQVQDLKNRMMAEPVHLAAHVGNQNEVRIAEMQEEIERRTRASLALCWLADSDDEPEDEEDFQR